MTLEELNTKYLFFKEITGRSMEIHREYKSGLLESAYEAALKYLLELDGFKVEKQVFLPIFWKGVQLDQNYRLDLVVNGNIIIELKAVKYVTLEHKQQLWNYMKLTKQPYGMIINFGNDSLYSEWFEQNLTTGEIKKVYLKR
jgi:GxxExxY protein